ERELAVRDDAIRVEELLDAEAVASGAGAERVVERKEPRLEFGHGISADPAGELVREHEFLAFWLIEERDAGRAFAQAQRRLEGLGEALLQVRPYFQPIDHRIDR